MLQLVRKLKPQRTKPDASASTSPSPDGHPQPAFPRTDSLISLESVITQNPRGPGSMLETMYLFFGDKLEKWINGSAKRRGRTPAAVKNQLEEIGRQLMRKWEDADGHWQPAVRPYGDFSELTKEDQELMNGLCGAVIRWVK